jgi:hypothetical protein
MMPRVIATNHRAQWLETQLSRVGGFTGLPGHLAPVGTPDLIVNSLDPDTLLPSA